MNRIKIKPLSVNVVWRGQRFKTKEYKDYEKDLFFLLPNDIEIPKGKLEVYYRFGLSSKGSDYDNIIKPLQDILQKVYKFNDNKIYKAIIEKEDVKKGEEFIEFEFNIFKEILK